VAVSIEDWAECVARHFAFLEEHGFHMAAELGSARWYRTQVVYVSETSAVEVDRSVEYQRVEVTLARLKDGALPPVRVFVTEASFDDVLLDNVVEARAPDRPRWRTTPGRTYDEQLSFWAETLRTVASDFLRGDFSAIEDGERAVRARLANPPRVSEREQIIQGIVEKVRQDQDHC
jgi:hypothetical protein